MEWVLRSPQIHSIFSNLGYVHADGYHVNENCNAALEAILVNILSEDKYLRSYRRSISFGENIKKDLIPLLIHAKEDKTIELLTTILVNLTIPIECLVCVDIISKNDFGRHTIFEINNLLASTKNAFTDLRATRVVIDFLKKNSDSEQKTKLLPQQCTNVSNSLLLLRNILHIPENRNALSPSYSGPSHTVQNQIVWNIFSQSIDKVLMKLMSIPDACHWGVTIVQFIALLYKDQHVVTLHKLLNAWLETAISESSEDNESNTTPDRGSGDDSSPMVTSDPTSDSSDTGGKSNDEPNSASNKWQASADNNTSQNKNDQQGLLKDDEESLVKGAEEMPVKDDVEMLVKDDGEMRIKNEEESRTKDEEEMLIKDDEEMLIKGAEEMLVKDDVEMPVKGGEEMLVKNDEETLVKDDKGTLVKDDGEMRMKNDQETRSKDDEEMLIKDDEEMLIKNYQEMLVQNDEEMFVKDNKQTSVHGGRQDKTHGKNNTMQNSAEDAMMFDKDATSCTSGIQSEQSVPAEKKTQKKTGISETSDCGYGTQIENQESISTSSNEEDVPFKKPVYQKPKHNSKQRPNTKIRTSISLQERKRKKIVKRGKSNIINVQGLTHKKPTDDDIANVMKEFTVDFLLKGYNSLVQTLHREILTNQLLEIDTSHFFWLVTYFLKFATKIELDLEHVSSVLSFDIASFLTAEGVNLCEQFELAVKLDGRKLPATIRRLHLAVTAIREFVQAIQEYKKISTLSKDDQDALMKLQIQMCDADELRSLLVLLIRHYNPKYQSKQYLQDLIVTNHILLIFLDKAMRLPEYTGSANMVDHLRQFATPEVMHQYGELLEDYNTNGEFVNDCIFTVMHHVGGDLDSVETMFQPKLLKTFSSICKSDFEICDDWNDLVEYVLNKFTRKTSRFRKSAKFPFSAENCDEATLRLIGITSLQTEELNEMEANIKLAQKMSNNTGQERWTEDEVSSLSWTYLQCNTQPDVLGEMMKLLKEDGIIKSKESIIKEMYRRNIINKDEYKKFMRTDGDRTSKASNKETRDIEIAKLCKQLAEDGKANAVDWVQKVLLDTCYAKIYLAKKKADESAAESSKLLNFEVFKKRTDDMPVISPVSYHSLSLEQSVPLVPWNGYQASACKDLKFLQLLHKLGFHMPVDSGKAFIRIPHFWTADFLYDVAGKISPIDTTKLKFSTKEFAEPSAKETVEESLMPEIHDTTMLEPDKYYQVHKQTHFATMVNFTPMPGCSYKSEASEIDSHTWLNVVQKSQEFKLTLKSERPGDIGEQVNKAVPPTAPDTRTETEVAQQSYASYTGGTPLIMPTFMTVKQEISTYSVHQVDNEFYNHSVCETASVASDLTRMYVSDTEDGTPGPDDTALDSEFDDRDSELDERDPEVDSRELELDERNPELDVRDPELYECDPALDARDPELDVRDPELDARDPELDERDPELDERSPEIDEHVTQRDECDTETDSELPRKRARVTFASPF